MTTRRRPGAIAIVCGLWLAAPGASAQQPAPATVNDIETLKKQIQALIAGQLAMQKQLDEIKTRLRAAPSAAAPAPAPSPVSVIDTLIETAGSPVKGAAGAKVTIVEFSDYECPFCGQYTRGTLPELTREYLDTGKVRYVFRNLPLESIHKNAYKAAIAAACAGDQNKYWPMHDVLFANQTALDAGSLANHGRAVGLDAAQFQQCLSTDKPSARIRRDQSEGQQAGAGSTPTFFVALTMPGDSKVKAVRMIRGAQPYPTFKTAIDSVLAAAK